MHRQIQGLHDFFKSVFWHRCITQSTIYAIIICARPILSPPCFSFRVGSVDSEKQQLERHENWQPTHQKEMAVGSERSEGVLRLKPQAGIM